MSIVILIITHMAAALFGFVVYGLLVDAKEEDAQEDEMWPSPECYQWISGLKVIDGYIEILADKGENSHDEQE